MFLRNKGTVSKYAVATPPHLRDRELQLLLSLSLRWPSPLNGTSRCSDLSGQHRGASLRYN
ncbi:hypothetical protein PROFUN_10571 [Planoprotostelium fungivorum]|uniref:Uncharacterized protein n=1 Tax=Planoprotostelium fungivorum TaxID=1890364 RepID=A0A2P6ND14_9EUKA|nr:hypothetical protein PROFUN_10571 [Planoprotostelium fungivorum]